MILVLAGTLDGRNIAAELAGCGYPVMTTVVSEYGKTLAIDGGTEVLLGAQGVDQLLETFKVKNISLVIDATHPYAVAVSRNCITACQSVAIPYIRFERQQVSLPEYDKVHVVQSYEQAAQLAAGLGRVVFLTTGSRTLKVFTGEPKLQNSRIVARVLPDIQVIAECLSLGLMPRDIIAMQGPFSVELNMAMFKDYQADVIVTKNSGAIGGTDTKFAAAMALNLPLVVIDRPAVAYPLAAASIEEIINFVRRQSYGIHDRPCGD